MPKTAIYPGTFDPITLGHFDIIERALDLFDEVIIAVATSEIKKPLFNTQQRVALVEAAIADMERVTVLPFDSLLVDFAKEHGSKIIVRGLRAVSDFEYELQLGYANQSLDPNIETVYLMPSLEHAFVSSSIIRNLLQFDGRLEHLVPQATLPLLKEFRCI